MKQVYYSNVATEPPSLPSTAVEGYPQDGNLSQNALATVPGAYFFYMIASEIENAIRQGGLTPDASDLTQLSQVISSLTNNDRTMLAHATLVTSSNMASICGSTMDGLTPQRNYILATNLDNSGMQNLPAEHVGGVVINWSRANTWQSGSAQMMCGSDGNFYIRQYWSNTWRAWRCYKNWDSIEPEISACLRGVSTTVRSGSINDLPLNRIHAIASTEDVTDTPEAGIGGFYCTLCRNAATLESGSASLYIDFNGTLWYRISNSAGWASWRQVASGADFRAFMHGVSIISPSTREEVCGNDLDNVTPNTIYTVGIDQADEDLAHQPNPGSGGLLMTMSRTNSNVGGSSRLFFGFDREAYHSIAVSAGWRAWRRLVSQDMLKICMIGDSIAYGGRNGFKGYVGDLGMPYKNLGIAGRLLSNAVSGRVPISDEMDDIPDGFVPDVFVCNGGVNDYNHSAPLGTPPTQPVDATCDTVCGGLQHLLYRMMTEYPRAQRFFVLGHRTLNWPYTANSAGYTQTEEYEALREVCKVFATKVIDVFNESSLNTALDVFKDDVLVDSDGIHPEALGYQLYYVPLVRQALMLGTAK